MTIFHFQSCEVTKTGVRGLGTVAAGLLSLMNNNCYPNTIKQFAKDKMVFYAAHPIKKGEQVKNNYLNLVVKLMIQIFE